MFYSAQPTHLAAAAGLSLTPGPNGLLSLNHGVRFGVRRTAFTAAGGVTGFMVLVAASLAGLGALLAASDWLRRGNTRLKARRSRWSI